MAKETTPDQVVAAAKGLEQSEFTRAQVASELGLDKREIRQGFNAARKAGQLKKTRDDADNIGHFKLTE